MHWRSLFLLSTLTFSLLHCSPPPVSNDANGGADATAAETTAPGEDASTAETTPGMDASMTGGTAVTIRFGTRELPLTRAQFGFDGTVSGDPRLYVELHAGGDSACPNERSPTPDRTLVLSGLRITTPSRPITEADGLIANLLDFRGDLLPSPAPSRASSVRVEVRSSMLMPRSSATVQFDLTAMFPSGTIQGPVLATHCDSLDTNTDGGVAVDVPQRDVMPPPDVQTMDAAVDVPSGEACAPGDAAAPMLNGPMACGTIDFGQPAAPAMMVSNAITFTGGTIPPGIYDAVGTSRTTGSLPVTFRATLVISSDGRYTEARQLTSSSTPGPITRRSGTFRVMGTTLSRMIECGADDGGATMDNTFSIEQRCGETLLHLGLTNLWFTYRRR